MFIKNAKYNSTTFTQKSREQVSNVGNNNNNHLYSCPEIKQCYINSRKKKLLRKRAQPLRNSKLIELSGWAKPKNLQIPYIKIELRTRFTIHTHTHAHTKITINKGKLHTQKLENKVHQ